MKQDLSNAEMEIMRVIWEFGGAMSPRQIVDVFNERGKDWKRQTVNTLLVRMVSKGVITKRRGLVEARYTEFEFRKLQSRVIVNHDFGGKLERFVAAFTGNASISDEDADELQNLINRLEEKGE